MQILKEIYTDTTIGPALGFKGGTAAYLFYGLGRFSVDLDFDLLDEVKCDYLFRRVEEIVKEYGVIREKRKKRNTLFLVLSYEDKTPNIKVEINLRRFGSKYELKSYLGISMLVMVKEDMFAHKLVAMTKRFGQANRDIFDIWFFAKNNWPVSKDIVEKRTGMPFRDFLKKCIELLEKWSDRAVLSGMGDLLDARQKAWVKGHLKDDTIFLLKVKLDSEK
ncbi:MAG: nucleotidyl transferase AbiEii/AbiGii toxin family protein [Nitrospiria bacterium]